MRDLVTSLVATIVTILVITSLGLSLTVTYKNVELTNLLVQQYGAMKEQERQLNCMRKELDEIQHWRVAITIASRSGWWAANRYIKRYNLPEREVVCD